MGQIVFITSIPRKSVTGISEFRDPTSGLPLNKNKIGKCTTRIQALYDARVGGLANYISYTPWIDPSTNKPFVEDGKELTLQDKLERKYNKPKGFYNNMPPRTNQKPEEATFFQQASWVMQDGTTALDLNTEMGELGYYVALASSKVANSEREWREHKWPRAEFYIAHENESDGIRAEKNKIKSLAFASLHDTAFTPEYKRKVVTLLDLANSKASITQLQVDNLLYDFIDKSGYISGSNIDKFNAVFSLIKTPQGREQLEARYLLAQAIDTRVVFEKQDTYTWVRAKGNIVIGDRYNDAVDYILNPKKQSEVEELTLDIKKKLL